MVKPVLGEKSAEKLCVISLSNDSVRRKICELSLDIKVQVIQEIKNAGVFSIQLDESTDVQSCSQLMVLVKYVRSSNLREEFIFYEPRANNQMRRCVGETVQILLCRMH